MVIDQKSSRTIPIQNVDFDSVFKPVKFELEKLEDQKDISEEEKSESKELSVKEKSELKELSEKPKFEVSPGKLDGYDNGMNGIIQGRN